MGYEFMKILFEWQGKCSFKKITKLTLQIKPNKSG
jgi:hypothetical protein